MMLRCWSRINILDLEYIGIYTHWVQQLAMHDVAPAQVMHAIWSNGI